jgi:hypothetical protein
VYALSVVRGILYRLLQSFALRGTPPDWYRRYLPLIVLAAAIAGGAFFWTIGTAILVSIVDAWAGAGPPREISPGVRGALVVVWLCVIGFVLTLLNLLKPAFREHPLVLAVPEMLYSWLTGMVAVAVGLLIGTTIFT